jgi:hypothetical protein
MKPRNFLFLTTIALFMAITSVTFCYASSAPKYITIQLTDNDYRDYGPQINCNGDVVWSAGYWPYYNVFLYERSSGTTIQLANSVYQSGGTPQINCNGDVVWVEHDGQDYEVFFYERLSGITSKLTNNDYDDSSPQINCNGDVVWSGGGEIFLYERSTGTTIQLANNAHPYISPQINCNGDVVWNSHDQIFLYERSTGNIIEMPNRTPVAVPQINENGDVVWGFGDWWAESYFPIFLYETSTGVTIRLSGSGGNPQISDNYVVWVTFVHVPDGDSRLEIYLYEISTGTTKYVANIYPMSMIPRINDNGELVWWGGVGNDSEVFLYESPMGSIFQLTDNNSEDAYPEINDNGDVVWMGRDGNDSEIFLALRITEVTIDIKPGSFPNSINLNSKGVVPVAVLTTEGFHASTVDPGTVKFAGASPVKWKMEDVDGDGDMDMLFHFETEDLADLDGTSIDATLSGDTTYTAGKRPIEGTDSVNIVPKKLGKKK